MTIARLALTVIGILAMLIGLVWIGQGTGHFPYPASSFMINQNPWTIYGLLLALAGAAIIWAARRYLK
ncbi:MAG: hypothetical protein WC048_20550 [Rhizobium sp.]